MGDDFDFSMFGLPFPGIHPGATESLMKGLIISSKATRTLYEEHISNGFTEEQAMVLVVSLQDQVVKSVAFVIGEIAVNYKDVQDG